MICRVVTLAEETVAGKIYPSRSQFPGSWRVQYADGITYTVYEPAIKLVHWHRFIMWRQSAGVYAVFGKESDVKALSPSAKNLIAYANQDTHGWRTYLASGTDSALGIDGRPIGAFADRLVTLTEQPPKTVSKGKPYIYGTMTITSLVASPGSTCGPVNMVECAKRANDEADRPEEIKPVRNVSASAEKEVRKAQ